MNLDQQTVEDIAKSPLLPALLGSLVALRGVPGETWRGRVLNVASGTLLSVFLSPAISEYFGMSTQAMQSAVSFAVGLFGLNLMAAVLVWFKDFRIDDYNPWKRQNGGDK